MHRLGEFFVDSDGMLSMSRLLTFLSFIPASWVLVKNPTEGMLGIYVGAYAVIYVGGKIADAYQGASPSQTINVDKANVVNPPPAV